MAKISPLPSYDSQMSLYFTLKNRMSSSRKMMSMKSENREPLLLRRSAIIAIVFILVDTNVNVPEMVSRSMYEKTSGNQIKRNVKNSVTIWNPQNERCKGNFNWFSSANQRRPAVSVREAAVDFRHASREQYFLHQRAKTPFIRVVLLATVMLDDDEVAINFPTIPYLENHNLNGTHAVRAEIRVNEFKRPRKYDYIDVQVDDVVTDPVCSRGRPDRCYPIEDPESGKDSIFLRQGVTQYCPHPKCVKCAGPEWQIVLSIASSKSFATESDLLDEIWRLDEEKNAELFVEFPVKIRSGAIEAFRTEMSLSCVSGLVKSTTLPPMPHLSKNPSLSCSNSDKSVMLLGNSLFGQKRDSINGRNELAHFAIRSLLGHVRFDTVVLPILTNHTASQRQHVCNNSRDCHSKYLMNGQRLLNDVARDINHQLEHMRVPPELWSRIIVMPFCRLGSDHEGFEKHYPCLSTYRLGQFALGNLVYTLFSQKHAWTMSLDADEMLIDESLTRASSRGTFVKATNYFNRMQQETGEGHLWFRWFDFRSKPSDRNSISERMRNGLPLPVIQLATARNQKKVSKSCYSAFHRNAGKSAISCSSGMGYAIHVGVSMKKNNSLSPLACSGVPNRTTSTLHVYHARGNAPRFGNCVYNDEGTDATDA